MEVEAEGEREGEREKENTFEILQEINIWAVPYTTTTRSRDANMEIRPFY